MEHFNEPTREVEVVNEKNKNPLQWIIAIVIVILLALVAGVVAMQGRNGEEGGEAVVPCGSSEDIYHFETGELCPGKTDPGPCAPGVLFNRDTGEACPSN